ncbi:Tn3 family transposase [Streptomyces sp. NPDC051315]|uniref:Tn3 family transposase n=1 Tax=Streptomyces sp. NPDC051315 TaxID=3365650 RepID=UPI003793E2BA
MTSGSSTSSPSSTPSKPPSTSSPAPDPRRTGPAERSRRARRPAGEAPRPRDRRRHPLREACGTSYDTRAWTQGWHIREETLARANAAVVNYHHPLPLTQAFGAGTLSSSDGQRFPVKGKSTTTRAMKKHFAGQGLST